MPLPRLLAAAALAAAAIATAVPALAVEPESGTISNASPRVDWKGETINGGATTLPAVVNGGTVAGCIAPTCETFALTLADAGDLTVTASSPNDRKFVMVEIVKPDGSTIYNGGTETESSTTVKIKKAATGAYEVRIANNALEIEPYDAFAHLPIVAAAAPAEPATQPQPAARPAATLSVVTRSLSARKSRKKAKLSISSSGPVSDVVVRLRKGSKALATGRLAQLNGRGTVALKLKRALKKGRYTVAVAAKDGDRPVGATAPLKVKK